MKIKKKKVIIITTIILIIILAVIYLLLSTETYGGTIKGIDGDIIVFKSDYGQHYEISTKNVLMINYKDMKLGDYICVFKRKDIETIDLAYSIKPLHNIRLAVISSNTINNDTINDPSQNNNIPNFQMNYNPSDDMKIIQVVNKDGYIKYDYNVYTSVGNVWIKTEEDSYDLNLAVLYDIITPNDIIEKAKLDSEKGLCKCIVYNEEKSIEYLYDGYTILLVDNKDIYIGMAGGILERIDLK